MVLILPTVQTVFFQLSLGRKKCRIFVAACELSGNQKIFLKLQHLAGRGNHLTCSVNKKV